jgi:hypothetical protein
MFKITLAVKGLAKHWSKVRNQEIGLILKIPIRLDHIRLKYNGVKRHIMKVIWKTTLFEVFV